MKNERKGKIEKAIEDKSKEYGRIKRDKRHAIEEEAVKKVEAINSKLLGVFGKKKEIIEARKSTESALTELGYASKEIITEVEFVDPQTLIHGNKSYAFRGHAYVLSIAENNDNIRKSGWALDLCWSGSINQTKQENEILVCAKEEAVKLRYAMEEEIAKACDDSEDEELRQLNAEIEELKKENKLFELEDDNKRLRSTVAELKEALQLQREEDDGDDE